MICVCVCVIHHCALSTAFQFVFVCGGVGGRLTSWLFGWWRICACDSKFVCVCSAAECMHTARRIVNVISRCCSVLRIISIRSSCVLVLSRILSHPYHTHTQVVGREQTITSWINAFRLVCQKQFRACFTCWVSLFCSPVFCWLSFRNRLISFGWPKWIGRLWSVFQLQMQWCVHQRACVCVHVWECV